MSKAAITIKAAVLARMMRVAAQLVERRNTLPILNNVCLRAHSGQLALSATNLDVQYCESVAVEGEGEFALTVRSDRLGAIASALAGDDQIALEPGDDHRMVVKSGRSRWQLPTLPAQDYPRLPEGDMNAALTMDGAALARMLARVLPAVSTEEARCYLQGPLWHGDEGVLALVATDGLRLHRVTESAAKWPDAAPEVILAPKAARIMQVLGEGAREVAICWSDRLIKLVAGDVSLTAKVIDGTFPNYRRLLLDPVPSPKRVDGDGLEQALKHVRIAGDTKLNDAHLVWEGQKLTVSMTSQDGGAAQEELPAECDEPGRMIFPVPHLLDMLNALKGETIEIHQREERQVTFRRVVDDGSLVLISQIGR